MADEREALFYNAATYAVESSYRVLRGLKEKHGTWEKSWEALSQKSSLINPEERWAKLKTYGVRLVLRENPRYPSLLRETAWAPFGLYIVGEFPKESHIIAMVGTRKGTSEGKETARHFARELASHGATIISGLALGIDAASHEGALDAKGNTVAVLAHGLDRFYPRMHERLAKKILEEGGAIISEYPPGIPTLPYRFLERNRIVAGLSQGVLVVEAPKESGALVTARFALEENRDVFVVPGPINHPNYRGSHALIRSGAELVTAPEDILESLGITHASQELPRASSREEQAILEVLTASAQPLTVDKIIELSKLQVEIVNQTLSFLLLKNAVKETGGGFSV